MTKNKLSKLLLVTIFFTFLYACNNDRNIENNFKNTERDSLKNIIDSLTQTATHKADENLNVETLSQAADNFAFIELFIERPELTTDEYGKVFLVGVKGDLYTVKPWSEEYETSNLIKRKNIIIASDIFEISNLDNGEQIKKLDEFTKSNKIFCYFNFCPPQKIKERTLQKFPNYEQASLAREKYLIN